MSVDKPRFLMVLVTVASLALHATSSNAQSNSNVLVTTGEWSRVQSNGPELCAMETSVTDASKLAFTLGALPAQDSAVVTLHGTTPKVGRMNQRSEAELEILPSGERFESSMI